METIYEICGITETELRQHFATLKTATAVAKRLGISRKTAGKYARSLQIVLKPSRPKELGRPRLSSGYGPIARWLTENPTQKLPRRISEAAKIIGVKPRDIYAFLHYKKRRFTAYLAKKPPLTSLHKVIYDDAGRAISLQRVRSTKISFDPFSFRVTVLLILGDSCAVTATMSLKEFERLYNP